MHFENNQQVCHTLNIEAFPVLFRHHILRPSFREPGPLLKHKFYKTCIYLVSNLFSITPMGFFFLTTGTCRYRTTKGNCCSFPFVYRGRRYNRPARARNGRRWCAITPDYRTNKLWGYCRGGRKCKALGFYCYFNS